MNVFIQLTVAGTDVGPFNLYSNLDLITPFASGVSRTTLVTGATYVISGSPTSIVIESTGVCTNNIIVPIISDVITLCNTLGSAANFVVLGHSTITNTGTTLINGDLGLFPGTSVTGFPPGVVTGTQHITDTSASNAKDAATAAFECLGALTPTGSVGADIGGTSINPGVYSVSSSLAITGTVTLNGGSDPNAVFIFQIPSTFIPAVDAVVELTNDAQPCNVYWLVGSSATLSVGSTTVGNIIAEISITINTNAILTGRAFALTGAVTMDTNSIAGCECTINPCDTTTTSTTDTPTTTTTTTNNDTTTTTTTELPCDSSISYTGGPAYPSTSSINLSSSLGYVTLDFDAYLVPDQYIVIFDGDVVINTGYRGNSVYDFGESNRSAFTTSLSGQIDPVGTTYPDYSLYPDDGYPRILGVGLGSVYFYKSTGVTSAIVNVYAPLSGTAWSYTLSCPTEVEPTTTTTTSSSSTTTTTTLTPTTTTTTTV